MQTYSPENVKWEILGELVELDWHMIWEFGPESLRTDFPTADPAELSVAAEQAIRALVSDGWVYFFRRLDEGEELSGQRLSSLELDILLRGDAWRTLPVGEAALHVWMAPTPAGVEAARGRWPEMFAPR